MSIPRPNPFLTESPVATVEAVPDVRDDALENALMLDGPASPDLVALPSEIKESDSWPLQHTGPLSQAAVMGLHGGAGTSTVASLIGETAKDLHRGWPVATNPYTGETYPARVVAVARDDAAGLAAAEQFLRVWASGELQGSELRALVLVASSPNLSEARKRQIKRLLRMAPHGTRIPWMDAWIEGPADPERLPLRIRAVAKALRKTTQPRVLPKETP